MVEIMTTSGAAKYFTELGCPVKGWQVRRAYETGLMAETEMRMGAYRIIKQSDLSLLENALVQLGYVDADAHVAQ